MKVTGYLQIVPKFDRAGKCIGARLGRATGAHPGDPLAGALLLRVTVDVPDGAFKPIDVRVALPERPQTATVTAVEVPETEASEL